MHCVVLLLSTWRAVSTSATPLDIIVIEQMLVAQQEWDFFNSVNVNKSSWQPQGARSYYKELFYPPGDVAPFAPEAAIVLYPVKVQCERSFRSSYPRLAEFIEKLEWTEARAEIIRGVLTSLSDFPLLAMALERLVASPNKNLEKIKKFLLLLSVNEELARYINNLSGDVIDEFVGFAVYSSVFVPLANRCLDGEASTFRALDLFSQSPAVFNLVAHGTLPLGSDELLAVSGQLSAPLAGLIAQHPILGLTVLVHITGGSVWHIPADFAGLDGHLEGLHQTIVGYLLAQSEHLQPYSIPPNELASTLLAILVHRPYLFAAVSSQGTVVEGVSFIDFLRLASQTLPVFPDRIRQLGMLLDLCLNSELLTIINAFILIRRAPGAGVVNSVLSRGSVQSLERLIFRPDSVLQVLEGLLFIVGSDRTVTGDGTANFHLQQYIAGQLSILFPSVESLNIDVLSGNIAALLSHYQPTLKTVISETAAVSLLWNLYQDGHLTVPQIVNACFASTLQASGTLPNVAGQPLCMANEAQRGEGRKNIQKQTREKTASIVKTIAQEAVDKLDPECLEVLRGLQLQPGVRIVPSHCCVVEDNNKSGDPPDAEKEEHQEED